ncbi:hypothetical protein PJP10_31975, partial [Mycobacterium kansasii]
VVREREREKKRKEEGRKKDFWEIFAGIFSTTPRTDAPLSQVIQLVSTTIWVRNPNPNTVVKV